MATELENLGVQLSAAELEYRDAQALGISLDASRNKINTILRTMRFAREKSRGYSRATSPS